MYFPKYSNIRIRERSLSVAIAQLKFYPENKKEGKDITARKLVLFAVNVQAILNQLVRNTEHVL